MAIPSSAPSREVDPTDWRQARSDMEVRAALLDAIETGRFSTEQAAKAAGVAANVIRVWRHRRKRSLIASAVEGVGSEKLARQGGTAGTDCEQWEKAELDGLAANFAKRAKTAEDGRDAKNFTDALAVVLDLRRRAHGLPTSRDKVVESSLKPRPAVLFISTENTNRPIRDVSPSRQPAHCIDDDPPPSLKKLLETLPAWQQAL